MRLLFRRQKGKDCKKWWIQPRMSLKRDPATAVPREASNA